MSTEELAQLRSVAVAAKALVRTASGRSLWPSEETVDESALTALESALADAGYDMTDEEFERRLHCAKIRRQQMKVELFTPETNKFGQPADMVFPTDATEDEYLFVEYEAYCDAQTCIAQLKAALKDAADLRAADLDGHDEYVDKWMELVAGSGQEREAK